jgi:hypothetical protein
LIERCVVSKIEKGKSMRRNHHITCDEEKENKRRRLYIELKRKEAPLFYVNIKCSFTKINQVPEMEYLQLKSSW